MSPLKPLAAVGLLLSVPLMGEMTSQQINEELRSLQQEFEDAKRLFNPWYTGPLLTGSASNVAPGHLNIQPYIFVTDTFSQFNGSRRTISQEDLIQVNPSIFIQTGILNWLDITAFIQGFVNFQGSSSSGNIGDSSVTLGFQALTEGLYVPGIRLTVKETFPSGRYQNLPSLHPSVYSTGQGLYQTSVSFNIAKALWWMVDSPMRVRFTANYNFPASTHVNGFNAYGGGNGANGRVKSWGSFSLNFGYEISFNQRWALATDLVYSYSNKATFKGALGSELSVGSPSSDQLSIAPALEYNWSENLGLIGGVWTPITGRNSGEFISGILSIDYWF